MQKKYSDAHALREEFQHMEIQEQEKYLEQRQAKLIKAEQQELQKQIIVR